MMSDTVRAIILGIVEGVTEFLPVSSTGHLLLAERFFGLGEGDFWKSFAVLIQLGAILAIVVLYFAKLWRIALGMFSDPDARRFVIGVLIAFLPAVVIGLLAGKFIKGYLFNPWVVCFTLIVGGAILLWVDQLDLEPHEHDATRFPLLMYLWIGMRAVPGDDPRRVALRRDDRGGDAARRRQARGGGVLVLPRDPDHGRRLRLRFLQEPRRHDDRSSRHHRDRLRGVVHHGDHRGEDVPRTTSRATASCCSPGGA